MNEIKRASKKQPPMTETNILSQLFALEENLNASITVSLKELEDRFVPYPSLRPSWYALKLFLRRRGKRVRPLLFLFSHQLFDERHEVPPMPAFRAAAALEIFHAFALIHDDIIDQSHSRRGAPTLHKSIESEAGLSERNGENLALVMGDILFGFAMEHFLDRGFAPLRATRALRFFLRVAQDTGMGQAVELAHLAESLDGIKEEAIMQTYTLKTTRYTIESPLILGAILAGAGHSTERMLSEFANPLGLAFQIENDLHEVRQLMDGDPELAYDLIAGVKTLYFKRLHDRLGNDKRAALQSAVQSQDTARIAQLLQSGEAAAVQRSLEQDIADYYKEAKGVLRRSSLNSYQRTGLMRFAEFIRNNSHHSEAEQPSNQQRSA